MKNRQAIVFLSKKEISLNAFLGYISQAKTIKDKRITFVDMDSNILIQIKL